MLAQKQPPFKECVIAHWSRDAAPKISGAQAQNRSRGITKVMGRGAYHRRRRLTGKTTGAYGSENAGMSSEKDGDNVATFMFP